MTVEFATTLLVLIAGAIGYLAITFWFRPILRYKDIRKQIISDLVFYANAINAGQNDSMKERVRHRVDANRRHSADLAAIYGELPRLYIRYLNFRGVQIDSAVSELLVLSNTYEWKDADSQIKRIHEHLQIKPRVA